MFLAVATPTALSAPPAGLAAERLELSQAGSLARTTDYGYDSRTPFLIGCLVD
jgi:hypothetical protein